MNPRARALLPFAFLTLAPIVGCSSSDKTSDPVVDPIKNGAGGSATAPPDGEWETLITGDWTLPPGTEGYFCAYHTVEDDLFVGAFEAINPPGTHHTLLTMGPASGPDRVEPCNAGTNRTLSAFGSGVGTDPLHFPAGVAMKVAKGTQLLLNLHLFNTSEEGMSGTSGTRIQSIPESDVEQLAEGVLAGTVGLNIPPGQTTKHVGFCSMTTDTTLIAVAPHMHQLGIYEKVVAEGMATGEVTLHDAAYDFNEQSYHLIEPLELAAGDRVRVECTHKNTTANQVTFGESSLAEMCFAGLYRYPAVGGFFICSDDFPAGTRPPIPN